MELIRMLTEDEIRKIERTDYREETKEEKAYKRQCLKHIKDSEIRTDITRGEWVWPTIIIEDVDNPLSTPPYKDVIRYVDYDACIWEYDPEKNSRVPLSGKEVVYPESDEDRAEFWLRVQSKCDQVRAYHLLAKLNSRVPSRWELISKFWSVRICHHPVQGKEYFHVFAFRYTWTFILGEDSSSREGAHRMVQSLIDVGLLGIWPDMHRVIKEIKIREPKVLDESLF